jgi:hypothetical protein
VKDIDPILPSAQTPPPPPPPPPPPAEPPPVDPPALLELETAAAESELMPLVKALTLNAVAPAYQSGALVLS